MITVQKLRTLGKSTRLRKLERILFEHEEDIRLERDVNIAYLLSIIQLLKETKGFPPWFYSHLQTILSTLDSRERTEEAVVSLRRELYTLRNGILQYLKAEPADWDIHHPESGLLDSGSRAVKPIRLYLEDLRSPFNIGAIFRAAESFGIEKIFLSETCPLPSHKRAQRTSMGCTEIIPWEVLPLREAVGSAPIFALELRGTPLPQFRFPEEGMALIGSEELGLSPEALRLAETSAGRVSIPQAGCKASLNVSVACGILLYSWFRVVL